VRLLQDRARLFAVINAAASIIAGLGAASLGAALAQALTT
jgi:CrcB protein